MLDVEKAYSSAFRGQGKAVGRALRQGRVDAVQRFVELVANTTVRLNASAGLPEAASFVVRMGILHEALLPLLCARQGRIGEAAQLLAGSWRILTGKRQKPIDFRVRPVDLNPEDAFLLELFNVAVTEHIVEASRTDRGRKVITRLMAALRLSFDELGRMLNVSGETVRRWTRGIVSIPEQKLAQLDTAGQALGRLLRFIRPDRLSEVVRRPADAFGGQAALQRILEGRIAEVADHYERELAYQA